MLNGRFENPDGGYTLGYRNFYRVADVWVNEEDVLPYERFIILER